MAYSCWYLPDSERSRIFALIPASYENVIAHHVTYQFGRMEQISEPDPADIEIVGFADDGSLQALVVEVNGSTIRPDGGTYHITWSLEDGRKPVQSNDVIRALGWTPFVVKTAIKTEPRIFK